MRSEVVVPEYLALIRSAQRMTDGQDRTASAATAPAAAPRAQARPRPRRPRPLHRLRHPHDRHPGLVGRHGVRLVLVVDHHDDGLLHPLRPDHRRARLRVAGRGRRLHLGAGGVRAAVGLDSRLAVLDQQRHLGPVGLSDLRGHVRADLPEDPLALAGSRHCDRADLADRPRRHRAARGLEVGAEHRRRGQGADLPRPRRSRPLGAASAGGRPPTTSRWRSSSRSGTTPWRTCRLFSTRRSASSS